MGPFEHHILGFTSHIESSTFMTKISSVVNC